MFAEKTREADLLLRIIRYILNPGETAENIDVTDWQALVFLARKNGVYQYVYRYMKQLPEEEKPTAEIAMRMEQSNALELRAGLLQDMALERLQKALETAGVDHMFVKGSVTKGRYPDRFLRTMGDIDLLYQVKHHEKMPQIMETCGFALKKVGRVHDIYTDQNNVLVEAHRQLMASSSQYFAFAEHIWDGAERCPGMQHSWAMRIEDEFLYNLIHLASHFKRGGVGIRFVVDVWVYSRFEMDRAYIDEKLKAYGLSDFCDAIRALAEKWFGSGEGDAPLLTEMEQYILSGGIFGNTENHRSAAIKNGRFRYFMRVCFPSYEEMQSMFPSLKHKAMLPVAWARRGVESVMKRRENIQALFAPVKDGNAESAAELKKFLQKCGLD